MFMMIDSINKSRGLDEPLLDKCKAGKPSLSRRGLIMNPSRHIISFFEAKKEIRDNVTSPNKLVTNENSQINNSRQKEKLCNEN